MFFGYSYDDKAKTFFRGFSAMENLYIKFYNSDVSKQCGVSEHMVV